MSELDTKIYEAIKSTPKEHYLGCELRDLEKKFVRPSKNVWQEDVWAAISRLCQQKRIAKSGSHRYKAYKVIEQTNVPQTSW